MSNNDSGTYERTSLANKRLSTVLTVFPLDLTGVWYGKKIDIDIRNIKKNNQVRTRKCLIIL